ncbi:alcohol dehydrogenase catalytic domain-containing protein [Alkalibaculum sp. M08DMB]|uniref:Alcohol dehydrogenase catalytic domain-containing protein n=1 Tax=Alkalibaculum sporogenes TaxID=2655001 RepID=A0A6A7KAL9_9FIRM|nr:alcohol dehydrogenase catalytic domain-containing protein [Alkalibaculum sporogenes]MPW26550.1 alcohol dehydrogenase catalytic domain-containing protein [Alkalibaculum sporogenes]
MEGNMKCAVLQEIGRFTIETVPIPKYGSKDILVRVKYSAICGSDVHIFDTGFGLKEFPFIIGHEFSGEIVEKGNEVEVLEVGDRVMGLNIDFCGECWWCKNGLWDCPNIVKTGIGFYEQGAFAEFVVIKNARLNFNVYKLPNKLDDRVGSLAEPISVGVGNVDAIEVKKGDKVLVLGAGIIGLGAIAAAKAKGAEVAVINRSKTRLAKAIEMGADHAFSPLDGDPMDWIINLWGNGIYAYHYGPKEGGMADIVIEAAGVPTTFRQAFEMVRVGGKICIAGTATELATIDPNWILLKNPKIFSGLSGNFAESVRMLANKEIDGDKLISHEFNLEQIQEAFEVAKNTKESIKVILKIAE